MLAGEGSWNALEWSALSRPGWVVVLSYLHGELSLGEVNLALLGLLKHSGRILGGETATDGTGVLWPEVEGEVLLVLVEETELRALAGVNDREDLCD